MLIGAHVLIYTDHPEADRAFFRDILGFRSVDVGGGWLIFALPPAEAAFHPTDGSERRLRHGGRKLLGSVLYLMCDDLQAFQQLAEKNVRCAPVETEDWGVHTSIQLPSGSEIGLYQPTHASPLNI
jgi:catechol 2,3-dioxygenase-like lactoylglutathione lyase family enzyme